MHAKVEKKIRNLPADLSTLGFLTVCSGFLRGFFFEVFRFKAANLNNQSIRPFKLSTKNRLGEQKSPRQIYLFKSLNCPLLYTGTKTGFI
jgi:hypothetical protein